MLQKMIGRRMLESLPAPLFTRYDLLASINERITSKTGVHDLLMSNIDANLKGKRGMLKVTWPFALSASEIKRTVIQYESFKLQTFVTAGVFPKRYFRYF